jgi:hypothetical protein
MFAEEQPALGPLPIEPFRYYRYGSSSTTSGCESCHTPPRKISWKSSCAGTNAPPRCSRQTDPWMIGASCSAIPLPSPRLDRLLHHAHVLKCGPRSWRTKVQTDLRTEETAK